MSQRPTISKVYSIFFLILTLFSLLGNNVYSYAKKENAKKKELTTQSDSSSNESNSDSEQLMEKPFNAVVNAGLQWDFSKTLYILPALIEFFIPEKINLFTHQEITPLPYFITLFHTSICVHAP